MNIYIYFVYLFMKKYDFSDMMPIMIHQNVQPCLSLLLAKKEVWFQIVVFWLAIILVILLCAFTCNRLCYMAQFLQNIMFSCIIKDIKPPYIMDWIYVMKTEKYKLMWLRKKNIQHNFIPSLPQFKLN